jgi:hypothetical protein
MKQCIVRVQTILNNIRTELQSTVAKTVATMLEEHLKKQIEILQLIALSTTKLMMASGLVKRPIHKNVHLLDFVFVVY